MDGRDSPRFRPVDEKSVVFGPHDTSDDYGTEDPRVAYDTRTGLYYVMYARRLFCGVCAGCVVCVARAWTLRYTCYNSGHAAGDKVTLCLATTSDPTSSTGWVRGVSVPLTYPWSGTGRRCQSCLSLGRRMLSYVAQGGAVRSDGQLRQYSVYVSLQQCWHYSQLGPRGHLREHAVGSLMTRGIRWHSWSHEMCVACVVWLVCLVCVCVLCVYGVVRGVGGGRCGTGPSASGKVPSPQRC
jgi:hypothetical protein